MFKFCVESTYRLRMVCYRFTSIVVDLRDKRQRQIVVELTSKGVHQLSPCNLFIVTTRPTTKIPSGSFTLRSLTNLCLDSMIYSTFIVIFVSSEALVQNTLSL